MKKIISLILVISVILSCVCMVNVSAVTGQDIASTAKKYENVSRDKYDCSAYVQRVYADHGISIPRLTYDQANCGTRVYAKSINELKPGDIICFGSSDSSGSISHVGIYDGEGYVWHSSSSAWKIKKSDMAGWIRGGSGWSPPYQFAVRVVGNSPSPDPTPTPYPINTNQIIKYGQSGTHVKELQQGLNQAINAGLVVDGKFGDATHTAVKNFQSRYGLTVDGDAGPKTLTKLNEVLATCNHSFETKYESSHPHKEYKICTSCNTKEYTGKTKEVSGCEQCYPPHQHEYVTKYESAHPHKQYKICTSCDAKDYTGNSREVSSCDECHEHDYVTKYETSHPHKQYKVCGECGDTEYTGKTRTVSDCDECHEHEYITKYNSAHPHKEYKECSDCGDKEYTGKTYKVETCSSCYEQAESPKRQVKLQIGVPNMTVDGYSTEIDPGRGTAPILQNSRTLLPIRAICESFGASVVWNQVENKVTVYGDDTTIEMWINSTKAYVDGQVKYLDVAPVLINSRTFMPIRFIAESLGLTVGWDNDNWTVTIEGSL